MEKEYWKWMESKPNHAHCTRPHHRSAGISLDGCQLEENLIELTDPPVLNETGYPNSSKAESFFYRRQKRECYFQVEACDG